MGGALSLSKLLPRVAETQPHTGEAEWMERDGGTRKNPKMLLRQRPTCSVPSQPWKLSLLVFTRYWRAPLNHDSQGRNCTKRSAFLAAEGMLTANQRTPRANTDFCWALATPPSLLLRWGLKAQEAG